MNKLYTMIGIPGSGKSTFAKSHPECIVVCPDTIRKELFGDEACQKDGNLVFKLAYERIEKALSENKDVIFDATNTTVRSRKPLLKYKAIHYAVFVNTDINECKKRNANRERKVPEDVIERMARQLTPPTINEGFNFIIEI